MLTLIGFLLLCPWASMPSPNHPLSPRPTHPRPSHQKAP